MTEPQQTPHITRPGTPKWQKWLIRMLAFFIKEVNEMRRQPKLLVSLVGGPFLVLLLFGITFRNMNPVVETILVLPEGGVAGLDEAQIRRTIGQNFTLVDITTNRSGALAQLEANKVDLVQTIPADIQQRVVAGQAATLEFQANTIDPTLEAWIQYLAYAEVNEINKILLERLAQNAQMEALQLQVQLGEVQDPLNQLDTALEPEELQKTSQAIQSLRQDLVTLETLLPPVEQIDSLYETPVSAIYHSIDRIKTNLVILESAINAGTIREKAQTIRNTIAELGQLNKYIDVFVGVPSNRIVSPVQSRYVNLRGQAYNTVVFHAPGVLALLIQHVAVTLGALALVRERLSGTFELFRVAPLNSFQLVLGKYLGYTLFVGVTSLALALLMRLINIPLQGSPLDFAGLLLLTTLASLGIGFVISLLSNSDLQAIQYTMLILLLAVFFSGIFLPLEAFHPVALYVSSLIPMTHAVQGFLAVMLSGSRAALQVWIGLAAIAAVSFLLVLWLTNRAFNRA